MGFRVEIGQDRGDIDQNWDRTDGIYIRIGTGQMGYRLELGQDRWDIDQNWDRTDGIQIRNMTGYDKRLTDWNTESECVLIGPEQ